MARILVVQVDPKISLTEIPLVGELVPPGFDFTITEAQLLYCTAKMTPTQLNTASGLLAEVKLPLGGLGEALAGKGLERGVNGRLRYQLGTLPPESALILLGKSSQQFNQNLPANKGAPPESVAPTPRPGSEQPATPRASGPLRLGGIRLALQGGRIEAAADVSLTVSGLTLTAMGLGLKINPADPTDVGIDIRGIGLGLALPAKGIALDGALLHTGAFGGDKEKYEGLALLTTPAVSVSLMGRYARTTTNNTSLTSMFIFGSASAEGPTGGFGPPPFRVKGISLGGGYNTQVKLPRLDQVTSFPLVTGAQRLSDLGAGTPPDPAKALQALDAFIVPRRGENWFAAGLHWTTFEYADFKAVALVEFGDDLLVSLLGVGDFTFPKVRSPGQDPVTLVEIAAEAQYSHRQGLMSLTAQLTSNSYVVTKECKPVGGLAACVWLAPSPYAGDFVFSVGGYHPGFTKPARYPAVPRIGIDWAISNEVMLRAQAYATVTPHAFMLGGSLSVTYSSGALRAWLTAHLDTLIDWCSGTYDVSLGISMGVSASVKVLFAHITVSVEVGVDVHMYGPPLGGTARVHLWFISFSLHFGSDGPPQRAVAWKDFEKQLPPPQKSLTLNAVSGRQPTPPGDDDTVWYVGTHGFTFASRSAVPATVLTLGEQGANKPPPENAPEKLYIRPITDPSNRAPNGPKGHVACHTVLVKQATRKSGVVTVGAEVDYGKWEIEPVRESGPQALWGRGATGSAEGDGLVKDQYVGMEVRVPGPSSKGEQLATVPGALDTISIKDGPRPLDPAVGAWGPVPLRTDEAVCRIKQKAMNPRTDARRVQLYQTLCELGCAPDTNDSPDTYDMEIDRYLTAEPLYVPAGG
ncbi:DUF6603 domain-containing protein [Streptomyces sp. S186]|uniref:DUF6603 domain-containing protein n=1 Tax=Streptomyces sp. S186 TaxID=3434395 RepID=UPI003F674671